MGRRVLPIAMVLSLAGPAMPTAQTPQPFPRPGSPTPAPAPARDPAPAQAPTRPVAPPPAAAVEPTSDVSLFTAEPEPSAETLGFEVYPTAQFLASYDAGFQQRYYLFGTTAPFADIVSYYRAVLDEGGREVFEEPVATRVFEIGRFREETMAFPPGVTVKDWSMTGSGGYPNPVAGGEPDRFPTIIMIVPPPPGAER